MAGAAQAGAEMAGTLKNVVALAAGFVDGLGLGPNSKAAVMRAGLDEMRRLACALYPSARDATFLESCGVADLIATCFGGRNRAVADRWAAERVKVRRVSPLMRVTQRVAVCFARLQQQAAAAALPSVARAPASEPCVP